MNPTALSLCLTAAATLHAQGAIQRLYFEENLGQTYGDVDADGVPDFVFSDRLFSGSGVQSAGRVEVRSGADGSLLHEFEGDSFNQQFGSGVWCADLDDDQHADLVVYAPRYGTDPVMLVAYSGATGASMWSLPWENVPIVSPRGIVVGDFDGDGQRDDIGVTMYRGGVVDPTVESFRGADGASLGRHTLTSGDRGAACFGAADCNGDGRDDFLLAERSSPRLWSELVHAISPTSGTVVRTFVWSQPHPADPLSFSVAGDTNGDGLQDVLVGWQDAELNHTGKAVVLSGADGTIIMSMLGSAPYARFGTEAGPAGDMDGDGRDDVFVISPFNQLLQRAELEVFSGADTSVLMSFEGGRAELNAGFSTARRVDDLDGDGHDDLAVYEADFDATNGNVYDTSIYGYGVTRNITRHGVNHERGEIWFDAPDESVLGDPLTLSLRGAHFFSTFATLLVGTGTAVPLDVIGMAGGVLYVNAFLAIQAPVPGASIDHTIAMPADAGLAGIPFEFQWVHHYQDAANAYELATSDALTIVLAM